MKQKGFTLIELLVVIAILALIAAVVALNVGGFFGRGTGNNETAFDQLSLEPITSLNLTELDFMVDYCATMANANPDVRSAKWPIMATIYQNQIIINGLQGGNNS